MQLLTRVLKYGVCFVAAVACAAEGPALALRAEAKPDRISIYAGDRLFTEYLFLCGEKYPYFYPLLGPRSGQSVTTRRAKEYPHHSSLFFGCDRVNGGNYWQEGLEHGRIAHQSIELLRTNGQRIVFLHTCRWERPGAEAPFDDCRKIVITAPSVDVRCLDFDIKLRARTEVRIEKTNHSFFSVRMAPDLSVKGGGHLVNGFGHTGEQGTFGRPAAWMDCRGKRGEHIEGLTLFDHPQNPWAPTAWFTRDYGFISPTPLNWLEKPLVIPKGEVLRMQYRVLVHAHNPTAKQLAAEFDQWIIPKPAI